MDSEVNCELRITNYGEAEVLPLNPPPKGDKEDEVFVIDATRLAANVGRNIATLIAKGIVQDHYDGDWSKVRFIGLEAELRDLPCPSGGGELREEHTLRSPKGTLREEHTPKSPLGRGEMRIAV